MSGNKKLQVYIALFFAIVFWGFSFVWTKQALTTFRPITVIFFRLVISVVVLFSLGKLLGLLQKPDHKDWKRLVLIAFWEPFAYFLGENFGLMHVSATTASVIIATIPLFSPIAAYYFHKERISWINFLGILMSVIGVVLVVLKPNLHFKITLIGLALMLWAVFSAVFYSVFVLDVSRKYNVYTIIAYQNLFGSLMFLPLFLLLDLKQFLHTPFVLKPWLAILQLSVFASSIAFMFFTYGIKHIGITRSNMVANLIPIFTAIFSFFVLGEKFTWFNILGIVVVVAGVILSQQGQSKITITEV